MASGRPARPITFVDDSFNPLKHFDNAKQAAAFVGCSAPMVRSLLYTGNKSYGGYFIYTDVYKEERLSAEDLSRPVSIYTADLVLLGRFETLRFLADYTQTNPRDIHNACLSAKLLNNHIYVYK